MAEEYCYKEDDENKQNGEFAVVDILRHAECKVCPTAISMVAHSSGVLCACLSVFLPFFE